MRGITFLHAEYEVKFIHNIDNTMDLSGLDICYYTIQNSSIFIRNIIYRSFDILDARIENDKNKKASTLYILAVL